MIPAIQPSTDDVANYAHVANLRASEGEGRPAALQPAVVALYEQYGTRLSDPSGPTPHGFPPSDHEVLRTNADYLSRAHFSGLRGAILASAGGNCAYCHQVKAAAIDHYLPRAFFGEYSVFAPNLTPICGNCNGKKSSRYVRSGGGRRYLHPYFDAMPAGQAFLHAHLDIALATVTFSVSKAAGMSSETWEILQAQFEDLDLGTRYGEDASNEIQWRLGSLYSYHNSGVPDAVAKYLELDRRSAAAHHGINHWRPVTLGALAASTAFCSGGFMNAGADPNV